MDVVLTLVIFMPLAAVLWLVNLAHRKRIESEGGAERALKLAAYGLVMAGYATLAFGGLLLQAVALLLRAEPAGALADSLAGAGLAADTLPSIAFGLWFPSLVGILLLTRQARRLAARFTSLDATNPVHAVALSLSALVPMSLLITLGMGLGNLAELMEAGAASGANFNPLPGLWAQNVAFLFVALLGVGWLARRTWRGTVNRLGIVLPSPVQATAGVLAGLLLVPAVLILELLASRLGLGASPDVERLTEQLIGPLTASIPGILTLGLAAALGEEAIFRGALQPRFGLLLTALLFALVHSQYGLSFSTVAVFGVGLVLGVLRERMNTTTAMITHAVYNMSLGAIAYLGWLREV